MHIILSMLEKRFLFVTDLGQLQKIKINKLDINMSGCIRSIIKHKYVHHIIILHMRI